MLVKVKGVLFYFLSYVLVSILMFISVLSDNDYDNVEMNFSVIFLCESVAFMFKTLPLLLDGGRRKKKYRRVCLYLSQKFNCKFLWTSRICCCLDCFTVQKWQLSCKFLVTL